LVVVTIADAKGGIRNSTATIEIENSEF